MSAHRSSTALSSQQRQHHQVDQQIQQLQSGGTNAASKTHRLQLVTVGAERSPADATDGKDEASSIPVIDRSVQVSPGKRGGRYQLPDGGWLTVPKDGGFSRTDSVTVSAIQPSELANCGLRLGEMETLVSPVYQVSSTVRTMRCEVVLELPLRLPSGAPCQFTKLRLMHKSSVAGSVWKETPTTSLEADNSNAKLQTRSLGTFLMLLSPLDESFSLSPNGGLVDFRIDPSVSLRVPKNALIVPRLLKLTILPFTEEGAKLANQFYRSETMDIAGLSPVYSIQCDDDHDHITVENDSAPIKRGVTVKLPMPAWLRDVDRKEAQNRLAIACRRPNEGKWGLVDAKHASVRITRNSVSFESKQLAGKFCFLDAPQTRLVRAAQGLERMEALNSGRPGHLALFGAFDKRRWALCLQCTPAGDFSGPGDGGEAIPMGWQSLPATPSAGTLQAERRVRGAKPVEQPVEKPRELLLCEGEVFSVQIKGDFLLRQSGGEPKEVVSFQFHQRFFNQPVAYEIVPTERAATIASDFFAYLLELADEEADKKEAANRGLVGESGNESLTFKATIQVLRANGVPVSSHELAIGFQAIKQYLDLKPPPPEPTVAPTDVDNANGGGDPSQSRGQQQDQSASQGDWFHYPRLLKLRIYELDPQQARLESQQRLLAPKRNFSSQSSYAREPRALSRRSLQVLSEQVATQGLSLAAELGVPESAVSALGFETMSIRRGTSGDNFAFKILLYWKRACATRQRGGLGDELVDALARIGLPVVGAAVRNCLDGNSELTPECFSKQE